MTVTKLPPNQKFPIVIEPVVGVRLGPMVDHPPAPPAKAAEVAKPDGEA